MSADLEEPPGAGEEPPPPEAGEVGVGDAPMRAAIVSVAACGLCFAVAGLAFFGARAGLGVLVGGALATANLWVFARMGQAFVAKRGRTAPWGVVAVLKLLALFGSVWLILGSGVVSGLSLAVGYTAMPFGITLASLFGPKPPESDADATPSARRDRDVIKGPRAGRKG